MASWPHRPGNRGGAGASAVTDRAHPGWAGPRDRSGRHRHGDLSQGGWSCGPTRPAGVGADRQSRYRGTVAFPALQTCRGESHWPQLRLLLPLPHTLAPGREGVAALGATHRDRWLGARWRGTLGWLAGQRCAAGGTALACASTFGRGAMSGVEMASQPHRPGRRGSVGDIDRHQPGALGLEQVPGIRRDATPAWRSSQGDRLEVSSSPVLPAGRGRCREGR